jgi:hypothetical protein
MTRKRPKILAAEPARPPARDLIDLVTSTLSLSEGGESARLGQTLPDSTGRLISNKDLASER